MNENFTIDRFTHKIADLPDQPTLSPQELKQRFDASPEELRAAHNALAKCVQGITDATYPDTVTAAMLAPAVREEIKGKAEQSGLAAETEAREALAARVTTVETAKCELYTGSYTGTGEKNIKTVSLGFRPKAVLLASRAWYGNYYNPQITNLAFSGVDAPHLRITETGFQADGYFNSTVDENGSMNPYRYIAFK